MKFVVGLKWLVGLAEDMKRFAERELNSFGKVSIEAYDVARDNGAGVTIKATTSIGCTLCSSSLGEKQVDAKSLGEKAAKNLCKILNEEVCVDEHVHGQLILFMALAKGTSRNLHCKIH